MLYHGLVSRTLNGHYRTRKFLLPWPSPIARTLTDSAKVGLTDFGPCAFVWVGPILGGWGVGVGWGHHSVLKISRDSSDTGTFPSVLRLLLWQPHSHVCWRAQRICFSVISICVLSWGVGGREGGWVYSHTHSWGGMDKNLHLYEGDNTCPPLQGEMCLWCPPVLWSAPPVTRSTLTLRLPEIRDQTLYRYGRWIHTGSL